jgi:hypothetical protein
MRLPVLRHQLSLQKTKLQVAIMRERKEEVLSSHPKEKKVEILKE